MGMEGSCAVKISANFRLEMNIPYTVARFDPKFQQAQKYLDNEVLKDCTPYVPMKAGNLFLSGQRGTVLGSGDVVYNTPYARACYYGIHRHFSKAKHPKACAQWFEPAKAEKKSSWVKGVNSVIGGAK